ncbi:transposase [Sinorhizobium medicae]|nr:transposase [Sinorhizobium medicae]MQU76568.1 transposase [Sinorhizobium medicae]
MAWYLNECCRRLAKIPGVGPIGAVLLVMKAPAPELFASGRQFAAWMGLTPRDRSTAGKVGLGVITRAEDEAIAQNTGCGRDRGVAASAGGTPKERFTMDCRVAQAQITQARDYRWPTRSPGFPGR